MTRKLTVDTPSGRVTRRTDRVYTHVVFTRGYHENVVADQVARRIDRLRANLAFYERRIAAGIERDELYPDAESYTERAAAARRGIADPSLVRADVLKWWSTPGVLGWCGRYDLALKLAERARKDGRVGVEIIPVNPEGAI